jgi:uncharacterized membrane protein
MEKIEDFLSPDEEEKIVQAIIEAEKETSGEIRVHVEKESSVETLKRAKEVFYYLKMDQTKEKNGVLFYVSVQDQKFAVIGDEGIDKVVPDDFWESVKEIVTTEFKKGNYSKGLESGILETGKKLQAYFPYSAKDDKNELSDEISKG